MIRSMTGFGKAAEQFEGIHYAIELRSLNNKYFKANIRLPEQLVELEAEMEAALRKRFARGSITATVKMRVPDSWSVYRINHQAINTYLDHLETIHAKVQSNGRAVHIDLTSLLDLPGVLVPTQDQDQIVRLARKAVLDLTDKAGDQLVQMRMAEGKAIAQDLAQQSHAIHENLVQIRQRVPQVAEEYHQRLQTRINEMLIRAELKVDESDLIREVAVFAERSDISEELSRLTGHLEQMQQIIDTADGDPAGRTLDFLAQELLREANTIASKCNDAQACRATVEIKSAIDRIKEQVQNIE